MANAVGMVIIEIKVPRQSPKNSSTTMPVNSTPTSSSSSILLIKIPTKRELS